MTSKMYTKVRLLRCPKCLLVLQLLADVPHFKCGGCGAVLSAKTRKPDANDGATSNIVQTSPAPEPKGIVGTTNLNQQSTIVSSEHAGKDQYDSTDSMKEQPGCINHSEDRFERAGSAKTLQGAHNFNKPRSRFSVPIGGNSPTARSYNAYDDSVSSFDGNNDQIADSHLIPRRRSYVVSSKEMPKEDVVRGKSGRNQNAMNGGKRPHENPGPMSLKYHFD